MNSLIFISLIFISFSFSDDYPLKDGKPTSKGIEQYIEDKGESLIQEYQDFVGDTLYDIWIYAEDLTYYDVHDSLELGRYYSNEIYIATAELFLAYELADLSKAQKSSIQESNKFVKSTVFHELTHDYFNQISTEMRTVDSVHVDKAYRTNLWIIRSYETFGSIFIEEGVCEYMAGRMGEIIPPLSLYIPQSIEELTNRYNTYSVTYKYSSFYVSSFLNSTGFKKGVKILLHNPPPTYEEILKPELFFSRLEKADPGHGF